MIFCTYRDSDGNLKVFKLNHNDDGMWLNGNYANPDNTWNPDNSFLFRFCNLLYFTGPVLFKRDLRYKLSVPTTKHFSDFV